MEIATVLKCPTCFRPKLEDGAQAQTQWISVCRCERPYASGTRFSIDVCAQCKKCVPLNPNGAAVDCRGICSCPRADARKVPTQIRQNESDAVSLDIASLRMTPANFPVERYVPIALLGDSARATVILARDKTRGTKVAVKCFKRMTPALQASFLNEAKKNQALNHTNIIKIVDFGFSSGKTPYVVTEYKDAFNLEQYIALYGTPSHDVAVKILSCVCDAIVYAQKQGLLHRSVKPGNILFFDDGNSEPTVLLTDFALYREGTSDLAEGRDAMYMSADEARNIDYSERSEIYSIGCVGYTLLTGQTPFPESSVLELKNLHALKLPTRISDIKFDNTRPRDLDELIDRCLEKDPSYRFDSIAQLAERLQVFPRREQALVASAFAAEKNKKILIIGGATVLLILVCILVFSLFAHR